MSKESSQSQGKPAKVGLPSPMRGLDEYTQAQGQTSVDYKPLMSDQSCGGRGAAGGRKHKV